MGWPYSNRLFPLTLCSDKMVLISDAHHHAESRRKVRILCLHGKGTNASVFASQTSSIRHRLRDVCEFIFVDECAYV